MRDSGDWLGLQSFEMPLSHFLEFRVCVGVGLGILRLTARRGGVEEISAC